MPRLDEKQLVELIGFIYDAALDPQHWKRFVERFADLYRGGAMFFSKNYHGAVGMLAEQTNVDTGFAASYARYYGGLAIGC